MDKTAVDSPLIDRLCEGDESAFEEIFQRYHKQLLHFANTFCKDRELAQEIAQEAFVQLWVNRKKLASDLPLYPYLFTQVRRMTIDAFRKKLVQSRFREEQQQHVNIGTEETAQTVELRELHSLVDSAVQRLPEQQQRVFEMSRIQGLTYDEIAEQLQVSKNTVKYHLVNALKNLRKALAYYELSGFILLTLPVLFG